MFKQLLPSLALTIVLMALLGLAYPLAITGAAQAFFPNQAHGSLIARNGQILGSEVIGQQFTRPEYFHPRPSATTASDPTDPSKIVPAPYNAGNSGGSNAAPSSKVYIEATKTLVERIQAENPNADMAVPVDLVTASASGLDPHISPAGADYQLARIAKARHVPEEELRAFVVDHTQRPTWGVLGESRINVLDLNLALDQRWPLR